MKQHIKAVKCFGSYDVPEPLTFSARSITTRAATAHPKSPTRTRKITQVVMIILREEAKKVEHEDVDQ